MPCLCVCQHTDARWILNEDGTLSPEKNPGVYLGMQGGQTHLTAGANLLQIDWDTLMQEPQDPYGYQPQTMMASVVQMPASVVQMPPVYQTAPEGMVVLQGGGYQASGGMVVQQAPVLPSAPQLVYK